MVGPNEEEPKQYEVTDTFKDQFQLLKKRLQPHRKPIIIIGSVILTLLVVFLGFAWIEVEKCNSVGGILDNRMVCHPGYYDALEGCKKIGGKLDNEMVCHTIQAWVDFESLGVEDE